MKKSILTLVLVTIMPAIAGAAEADSVAVFPAILKVTGSMGIILGLILLFYYLSRKGITLIPSSRAGAIKVVETRYLMPKKAVSLVRVRGREFLLGIGNDRVELLTPVDWDDTSSVPFNDSLEESLARNVTRPEAQMSKQVKTGSNEKLRADTP